MQNHHVGGIGCFARIVVFFSKMKNRIDSIFGNDNEMVGSISALDLN